MGWVYFHLNEISSLLKVELCNEIKTSLIIVEQKDVPSLESDATNIDEDKDDTDNGGAKPDDSSQWMGKVGFFSGNPTVETVKGILHIYKNK